LSEEDLADLRHGVALFNAGEFWESHEAWEKIWQRHAEPWRYFIQGLIQAAAAHHQWRRGIRHGAIKHLKNSLAKLETAPPGLAGLDIGRFLEYLRRLLCGFEATGRRDWAQFDKQKCEGIYWLNPSQMVGLHYKTEI
jgi:predicted metal-dependent hydrolase